MYLEHSCTIDCFRAGLPLALIQVFILILPFEFFCYKPWPASQDPVLANPIVLITRSVSLLPGLDLDYWMCPATDVDYIIYNSGFITSNRRDY